MTQIRLICSNSHARPGNEKDRQQRLNELPTRSPMRSSALLVKVQLLEMTRPALTGFVERIVDRLLM